MPAGSTFFELFALVHSELLLFAAVFFALGLIDELAVDLLYLLCRVTGRSRLPAVDEGELEKQALTGRAAVFIPAWREASVIGATLAHALNAWPQRNLRIYVGCYSNDPATLASASAAARSDSRVRLVVVTAQGPTCKAHCLNRLYEALLEDEARSGHKAHMVVLHDAEDMVDPAALPLLDRAIWHDDFVQLPVMALPPSDSRWIASHYSDEFAEAHSRTMVVRHALGCAIPGAGVGCAIARPMLHLLAASEGGLPFATGALTEDYELGMRIHALDGGSRFLRARTTDGRLVATRSYFPDRLATAVRQKTRWVHGIALQGWDRLGWDGSLVQRWMMLRDRRGPLAALLLFIAYALVLTGIVMTIGAQSGIVTPPETGGVLEALLLVTSVGLVWRLAMRALFTAREYGIAEGVRAIPRAIVSNVIAIMSGRRALLAYLRTLRGAPVVWDKTEHSLHPALLMHREKAA